MQNIQLRNGTKSDLPQVLALIKELAVFEKAPDQVINTINDMEKDFSDDVFNFFVAETENKIVGIALYFIKYSIPP